MTRNILSGIANLALAPFGCQSAEEPPHVGGEDASPYRAVMGV